MKLEASAQSSRPSASSATGGLRPAGIHPESQREAAAPGPAHVVGQGAARSDASPVGSVLRTAGDRSHGFRPNRGCHTGSRKSTAPGQAPPGSSKGTSRVASTTSTIRCCWTYCARKSTTTASCGWSPSFFGLATDWKRHATYSGTPQGSIVSPILANIYMDRLDRFVEGVLLPHTTRAGCGGPTRNIAGSSGSKVCGQPA